MFTVVLSITLLLVSAALVVMHVRAWRTVDHGGLGAAEREFHERRYRRRLQSSLMLGVIGLLVLGDLWLDVIFQDAWARLLYYWNDLRVQASGYYGGSAGLPHEQSNNPYQDISQTFRHFFARKYMFVRFASAYVVMPGGFGTLDELMEALTLIQTGKARKIPLILVCSEFWGGMIAWFKERLVAEGMVDPEDIDLIQLIDEPEKVVEAIFKHYEARPFGPLPNEHEMLLNL